MGKPVNDTSLDAAASTGAGSALRLRGHYHLGLFVALDNYDAANDTVEVDLEISPNGNDWATLLTITDSEIPSDGTAFAHEFGVPAEFIRATATTVDDAAGGDLAVTACTMGAGWEGPGVRGGRET